MENILERIERLKNKKDVKGLINILRSDDYQIKAAARDALFALDGIAFKELAKTYQDQKGYDVDIVLSMLANDPQNQDLRTDILGLAIKCTQHKNVYIRQRSVSLLGDIKLAQADGEMRKQAFEAIMKAFHGEKETYPDVRGSVMAAIEKQYADLAGEELLLESLTDRSDSVRIFAGQSLGVLKWKPGLGEIGATYYVARCSYDACEAIGFSATTALTRALKWGKDTGNICAVLGRIGDRRAIPALLEVIAKHLKWSQMGVGGTQGIEAAPGALAEIGGKDVYSILMTLSINKHIILTTFDRAVEDAFQVEKSKSQEPAGFMVMLYSGEEPQPHALLDVRKRICDEDGRKYRMLATLDSKGPLPKAIDSFIITCLLLFKEQFAVPMPAEDAIAYRIMETSDDARIGVVTFTTSLY